MYIRMNIGNNVHKISILVPWIKLKSNFILEKVFFIIQNTKTIMKQIMNITLSWKKINLSPIGEAICWK